MDPGMDVGMTLSQMMAEGGITLDPGYYVMSSGPRLDDGSVLNHLVFFTIESGKKTNVELIMHKPIVETFPETSQNIATQLRIVAYLDSGSEPTTHAMQEFSILKSDFEKWGGSIEFVFRGKSDFNNFKSKKFNELPDNIVMKIDSGVESANLPLFTIVDENDEIVYSSQGYKIGLGEQMRNILMH